MKKILTIILAVLLGLSIWLLSARPDIGFRSDRRQATVTIMKLTSSAFQNNGLIPSVFTCDGSNYNPPLSFSDIPAEAVSLTLIMDDPDVPKDLLPSGVFDHWAVFNIPPATTGAAENSPLAGIVGNNGAGKAKYTGPCPPDREHRYFFRLYALDTLLDLPTGATKAQILAAMQGHIIGQAELIGRYNRPGNAQK
jgi:Raf kinase inhibitor-like YbhB/YbcL family protein